VVQQETKGQLFYDLGNKQWDIPELRFLLQEILTRDCEFDDFEVECEFPNIGPKKMLLNARRITAATDQPPLILLAIEESAG
jgi:hypothetical protein